VSFASAVKKAIVGCATIALGDHPRVHRIPFGPLRGHRICTAPQISMRMYLGMDEPWVAGVARRIIKPGDIIYDIGAHVGYTTLLFARILSGTGSVHAFEVLPSTVERFLTKTVQSNEFDNIHIHTIGLGENEAIMELPVGPTRMSTIHFNLGDEYVETYGRDICRVVRLEDYVAEESVPTPSLMKIDIEGAEVECLRGAKKIILEHRPMLLVEFHTVDLLREGYAVLTSWRYKMTAQDGTVLDQSFVDGLEHFHQSVLCLPESKEQQARPCG
jgi:FkbM family methyltransferase